MFSFSKASIEDVLLPCDSKPVGIELLKSMAVAVTLKALHHLDAWIKQRSPETFLDLEQLLLGKVLEKSLQQIPSGYD